MTLRIQRPNITRRLVPLMDILFLLLSFFIILPHGTRAAREQAAKPPDWSSSRIDKVIEMTLGANGLIAIGSNAFSIEELGRRALVRPGEKAMVLVRVSFDASHRDFKALRQLLDARHVVYVILQEQRR